MTQALIQPHASLAVPIGNLDAYISAAHQLPILTLEEERHLAIQLQEHNDLNAARALITHHLRFVVKIARSYSGYGLALGDLIQEGNVGLMKAVKRFDPTLNVRLVSFAVHWIRAEIHEFILRNWRIVKVATTKAQRKLFFNLRSAKKRLGWLNLKEVESVAMDLGVTPDDVIEMENRLNSYDVGFDLESGEDSENYQAPLTYLTDRRFDPARVNEQNDWDEFHKRRLRSALETLDKRSRDILTQRWLSEKKLTLGELAEKYQVSAERIRQLEGNAIKKLRNAING